MRLFIKKGKKLIVNIRPLYRLLPICEGVYKVHISNTNFGIEIGHVWCYNFIKKIGKNLLLIYAPLYRLPTY